MFEKWKRIKKRAKEINREEEQQKPHYNLEESLSSIIHACSSALLCYATVIVVKYFWLFWQYDLFLKCWKDVVLCVLAESVIVCWAICWWGQISPKLITARHPLKRFKFGLIFPILIMPFYAMSLQVGIERGDGAFDSFFFIILWFGSHIIIRFGLVWLNYKNSSYYKRISFIDYCNLPRSE